MKYYRALKRNAVLTCATAGMNLEDIALSEVSQTQRFRHCRPHLWEGSGVVQVTGTERRLQATRGWEWGMGIV